MSDLTGQTLGQYRIVEPIGRGGMASVYKAYQPSLDRYVAIKVLPPYYAHEPGFAMRFTREAKAVAQLDHPNVLPIYDFGQQDDLSYIVMKYVAAGTLKEMMGQPLPLEQATQIVEQIAAALDHAHEKGVIHRDVKPSNVLMDRGQWALLMDFGLAKMVAGSVQLTASGVGVGTPAYMSPEQGQGGEVDARADVYSLGVVLYEMLTGRLPFDAETPLAVVLKHITDPLPLPRAVNPAIPEPVERVLLKALAKEPAGRYAGAGKMAAALRQALVKAGTFPEAAPLSAGSAPPPPQATPPLAEEQVEAPARRKLPRWALALGGVALVALIGVILAATSILSGDKVATPTGQVSPPSEAGQIVERCQGVSPPQLCIRDVQTRRTVKITDDLDFEVINGPAWSPDGRQIVFAAGAAHSDSEPHTHKLYVINADGSDLRQITHGDSMDDHPDWSPDGKWIAFMRNGDLWLIHPDGSEGQVLLERTYNREAWMPKWSPDGQRFAFFNFSPSVAPEIWIVERDGSEPRRVYSFERPLEDWAGWGWSPDGGQIAAEYQEGGRWACLIAHADGSSEAQQIDACPAPWSLAFWPRWGKEIPTLPAREGMNPTPGRRSDSPPIRSSTVGGVTTRFGLKRERMCYFPG